MFRIVTKKDWEKLVKKQLKTDDIYSILAKENLEGIEVKPYYDSVEKLLKNLPKVEESTHLVSKYYENADENVFAFLIDEPYDAEDGKALFVTDGMIENEFEFSIENKYFSLLDVFNSQAESGYILQKDFAERLLKMPFKRNICVDVAIFQNAGASIVQQLGLALAKTKELTEVFGGVVLNKLIFRIAVGSNYFFEIAKVRALKILINQFSKEFGLNEIPYIFAETSLRNKSVRDEENNLIRSTLELASAMIGGADAIFANDFKISESSELSEEISFKQQIVLAYESIINVFEDASNGSYYVEDITRQIAEKSWKYFLEMEDNGGFIENLNNGKIQKKIYEQATEEQRWVEEGKIKLIGVNLYPKLEKVKEVEEMYSENRILPVRWAEMFE